MADTYTSLANVIVPEIFVPYVIERTAAKSKILQSGIAVANPRLNELVTRGGTTMKMPFWQDLQGRSQLWTEGSNIEVKNITAEADIAALLLRAQAWGATDMSGALAGDDPMRAIGELVSDYWARDEQTTLLYILKGVFASSSMADHIFDGSSSTIDGSMVLNAKQLMGDASDKLVAIAMHSATFTSLQKQNLITTVMEVGPSNSQIAVPTYLGYRVVIDDSMPYVTSVTTAGVYTLTISTKGIAGDKIKIGNTELTFVANDSTATGNVVKVGATPVASEQATNIATFLNAQTAGLKDYFTITASSNTITFTNKFDNKRIAPIPTVTVTKTTDGTIAAGIASSTTEVAADVYTSYLFARGVIGRGEGTPVSFVPVETDRNSLGSKDVLIHRRAFVMHPYGIKWAGSSVAETPSDSELQTGSNWVRVYESKNIGMVAIKHKIS